MFSRRYTSPAGKILQLLQRQGPGSIKDFATALGVTSTAVRQQLMALLAAGLVTTATVRQGRGRPRLVYRRSAKAQALLPQGYADLALVLLQEVLARPEPSRGPQVLQRLGVRLGQQYAEQMRSATLGERLQELGAWLAERGIASKIDEEAEAFVLTAYGCPSYGLARQYRQVCEVDIAAMTLALGAPVRQCQSQLDGQWGCRFRVTKAVRRGPRRR